MKYNFVKLSVGISMLFTIFGVANAQFYPILTHFSAGYPVATGTDSNGATYYISASSGDYEEVGTVTVESGDYYWIFTEDSTYNTGYYISNNGTTPAFNGVVPNNINSFDVAGRTIYAVQFQGSQCNTSCSFPASFSDLGFAQGATSTGYRMYGFYATTSSSNFVIDQATMYSAIGYSPPATETLDNWGGAPATTTIETNSIFTNDYGDWLVSRQQVGDGGNKLYYWNVENLLGAYSAGPATSTRLKFQDMTIVASSGERFLNIVYETVGYSTNNTYACPSSVKDINGTVLANNVQSSPNTAISATYSSTFGSETHRFNVCTYDLGPTPNISEGLQFEGTIPSYRQNTNTFRVYGIFTSSYQITNVSFTTIYTFQAYINTKIQNDLVYYTKYFTPQYPISAITSSTTAQMLDECFTSLYDGLLSSATYYNLGVGLMCGIQVVIGNFFTWAFVPEEGQITFIINTTINTIKHKSPIGYLTRMGEIWSSTSTSPLPTFTVSIPFGANEYEHLTFNMDDMFQGANNLLDTTLDPIYGKSLKDVTEIMVMLLISIGVLYTIITDMSGLGLASKDRYKTQT